MRIAKDTYMVASGVQGCSMTDELDCNCYAFDSGDGLVLIDTGAGRDVGGLFARMAEDGLCPDRLTHVFLTHGHADHSGGAAEIVLRVSAKLFCGALTKTALANGEEGISLWAARNAGVYPADYAYTRPEPDQVIEHGDVLEIGHLQIRALATPGHSCDHTSYLVSNGGVNALVTGDALFHSGRIIYQASYDFDIRQSCESIEALSRFEFEALLPGHGMFVLAGAKRHVGVALADIKAMKPPAAIAFAKI